MIRLDNKYYRFGSKLQERINYPFEITLFEFPSGTKAMHKPLQGNLNPWITFIDPPNTQFTSLVTQFSYDSIINIFCFKSNYSDDYGYRWCAISPIKTWGGSFYSRDYIYVNKHPEFFEPLKEHELASIEFGLL